MSVLADERNRTGVNSPTGAMPTDEARRIVLPFDQYEIVVAVTEQGHPLAVVEVRVRKDFLSSQQRVAASGYHDVDDFYRD